MTKITSLTLQPIDIQKKGKLSNNNDKKNIFTLTHNRLAVNSFQKEANKVELDLTGDSDETLRLAKQIKKWDSKKKKIVTINPASKAGKIKTESGAWIPATYKGNRYAQWKEKNKTDHIEDDNNSEDERRMSNGILLR